jgi:hypothetical protein
MPRYIHYEPLDIGDGVFIPLPLDLDTCVGYPIRRQDDRDSSGPGSVIEVTIYHTFDLELWVEHQVVHEVEWDPSGQNEEKFVDRYKEIARQDGERRVKEAGYKIQRGRASGGPEPPPVVASQAAVARALKISVNYTKLIEKLKEAGTIQRAEKVSKYKWRLWFTDPADRRRVLDEIEDEGPRRAERPQAPGKS